MTESVPLRGTYTFLFTDIEGSTGLEGRIGRDRYGELLERHRTLLREAWAAHDGAEQGTEGDSFFVVFPEASSAVEAAVAGQRALLAEPWPDDAPIRVRMGLHSGAAEQAGESLVGLSINRAARIAAVAHGGQVLASALTRDLLVDHPIDGVRLVDLTGPGGTGKTRLSLQLAARAADDFPDGVFFVPLEPIRDPMLVAPRIATAVGVTEGSTRPIAETLADWLRDKRLLLVLDNFEQVVAAAPVVADLLRAAPDIKAVVTSRAVLHVSGEQEYPVPGLPTPPDPNHMSGLEQLSLAGETRIIDPVALGHYAAVRLFIERAVAVRPGFAVTNENAPAVAAISARLHGMPLAIELAAARIKILSPEAILARLEHQLDALASGSRDLPERQQTLRGAIAWSYDLLDDGS